MGWTEYTDKESHKEEFVTTTKGYQIKNQYRKTCIGKMQDERLKTIIGREDILNIVERYWMKLFKSRITSSKMHYERSKIVIKNVGCEGISEITMDELDNAFNLIKKNFMS